MQTSLTASSLRVLQPAKTLPGRMIVGLCATLAVALAAHVALPLPFTPVPLTLQPLAVLLVGLLLGPLDGGLAMAAYLLEGAAGLPVFSPTLSGGVVQLFGPTGGFLLAYPAVAAIAGGLSRVLQRRAGPFPAALAACTLAITLLFLSGAGWLMHLRPVSLGTLWLVAVAPFLPGEAVKILAAAGIYRALTSPEPRS